MGEFAELNPMTGALRSTMVGAGPVGGLYGTVGELSMVFYRRGGLVLRVNDQVVDLDAPGVRVTWQRVDPQLTRFVLTVGGAVGCDVRYRCLVPELDLGLLIRDVLADPQRRTRIFAG